VVTAVDVGKHEGGGSTPITGGKRRRRKKKKNGRRRDDGDTGQLTDHRTKGREETINIEEEKKEERRYGTKELPKNKRKGER
jgi:hypothetical protein